MNVRSFLIDQGLIAPHDRPSASGQFQILCPTCEHPKQKCYVSALGKGVHCKHCGWGKSWRGFQRLYEPPTPEEVALETFVMASEKALEGRPDVLEYLNSRGLETSTLEALRIGFWPREAPYSPTEIDQRVGLTYKDDLNWFFSDRIIIPYLQDGFPLKVRGRALPDSQEHKKYADSPGAVNLLYVPEAIDPSKPVIVCEGEFDTALVWQHGYHQAVGVAGANSFQTKWFEDFPTLYLAFDNDNAGRAGADKLVKELPEVRRIELPDNFDVSDYVSNFTIESFNALVDNATLYVQGSPQKEDRIEYVVDQWGDWAWNNNELLGAKIGWAPRLEKAISGWSKGLLLLASMPNTGKSCFIAKSAYEGAKENPDTVFVMLSLDDDQEDSMTRLVSLASGISFEDVRSPRWNLDNPYDKSRNHPELLKDLNEALEELKGLNNLVLRDAKYGRSLDYLRSYFKSLRTRYPDNRIVVFIDSLAKVSSTNEAIDAANKTAWKAYLASELKYLRTLYDLCIVTPADFRKINGDHEPTNDDIKDAKELEYESDAIFLGYNEIHVKGLKAVRKWEHEGDTYPVIQWNLSKNKKGLYKGKISYRFHPLTSDFIELTEEEERELEMLVEIQAEEDKRSK